MFGSVCCLKCTSRDSRASGQLWAETIGQDLQTKIRNMALWELLESPVLTPEKEKPAIAAEHPPTKRLRTSIEKESRCPTTWARWLE
eukprot:4405469-Amphidinium_carterae.1